jgi:NADH dehydrogenase FAD-containing subunit
VLLDRTNLPNLNYFSPLPVVRFSSFRLSYPSPHTMLAVRTPLGSAVRSYATHASGQHAKFLVVGGGSAGVAVAAQLQRAFAAEKRPLREGDLAIIEPASEHHCEFVA